MCSSSAKESGSPPSGRRRTAAGGKAVLLSSHVLLDGRRGGDVLTVLDAGRVVASGPPQELLARPEGGEPLSFAELLRRRRAPAPP